MSITDTGRRKHYGEFYGTSNDPGPIRGDTSLPFVTVVGNCQAESLRILVQSSGAVESLRIPPIHEFTAEDASLLRGILAHTDVLVTQPIRDSYRDLPVGTAELSALLPAGARTITYPVLRFDGLFPYHAIIRDPSDPSRNPPLIPYHDLRLVLAANRRLSAPVVASPSDDALRQAAELSIMQLRIREHRHATIAISDALKTTPVWHTINHPDNATLATMAQRVLDEIAPGHQAHSPDDREMLGGLDAPVDPDAARALGVHVSGREQWDAQGAIIGTSRIVTEHLHFYRANPQIVRAGLDRHAERLSVLGIGA